MADKSKNQYKTSGEYKYRYVLPEIPANKGTLTFRVMAASDAHIALSSQNGDSNDIYEIVLGAGTSANRFSTIRRGKLGKDLVTAGTKGILNPAEFRHFFVSFRDGNILVGEVGNKAILQYSHDDSFAVKFIGFSTGFGITGVWDFCDFGNDQYKTSSEFKYRYELPEVPECKRSLTFSVMAASDAHIALSSENGDSNDIYEIVLGAGRNTFSTIRRGKLGKDLVTADTKGILNPAEFRHFFVSFRDGNILVGEVGNTALLEYSHDDSFAVKFIGFSTGFGSTGIWEFCDFGN